MGKTQSIVRTTHQRRADKPHSEQDGTAHAYYSRTYSGLTPAIWPPLEGSAQFSIKDLASHLAHVTYFPESFDAPFPAAQYAVELAVILRRAGPLAQLHALLMNACDGYLGYEPPVARAAKLGMTMPPRAFSWDEELRESLHGRILAALEIPDFGRLHGDFFNAILYARDQLDVTLERDIGAFIYRARASTHEPLPRVIKPQRWDRTIERYLQTYSDLTALCGLPDKR